MIKKVFAVMTASWRLTFSPATIATALAVIVVTTTPSKAAAETVIKSPTDDRQYEHFSLPNGLGVLVISDPSTDKAAASLDINVGSGSSPPGREGLAHFLEHLLFLGTQRYPEPGEYKDFMLEHGGGDNAYTSYAHTNYYFNVDAAHLEPALDRFSQFFVAPLFSAKYVARERQVVHSEFTSNLKNDGRRVYSARRRALNSQHPRSRFTVGTKDTLADRDERGIRAELIDFYAKHYSAGLMKLVVLGREPLATLRGWVEQQFADVRNTGAKPLHVKVPLFTPGRLPARLDVEPIRERRSVSFAFPMPSTLGHYRTKPVRLIGDLLGHEGPGSLLALLKERGWAQALSAGGGIRSREYDTFEVNIQLTPQGLANLSAVGELLFATIDLIRAKGMQAWRYEELARLSALRFRYEEKHNPGGYVRAVANDMHDYPPVDLLRAAYLMEAFEPEVSARYLAHLRPDNMLMVVMAKGTGATKKTPYYEVPYRIEALDSDLLKPWSSPAPTAALALPQVNDFIPLNLDMAHGEPVAESPRRIVSTPGYELWHALDTSFKLPHSAMYASFRTAKTGASAREAMLIALYLAMVNDELSAFTYPAAVAGMSYSLYGHRRGFTLRLNGYSDREARLLTEIVSRMAKPALAPARFAVIKTDILRRYRNLAERPPHQRSLALLRHLLLAPHWSSEERLVALQTIELQDLREFVPRLLSNLRVVVLTHGNLDDQKAKQLGTVLTDALSGDAHSQPVPKPRVVKLESGANYLRNLTTDHLDDSAIVYLQLGNRSDADRAHAALLEQILEPAFYDQMRTEKKLGYVVFTAGMSIRRVPGLAFIIQSPSADAASLDGHISAFAAAAGDRVEKLSTDEFERNKESLVTKILEKENQLLERTRRFWLDIDRQEFGFNNRERFAKAVLAIELGAFRQFVRTRVSSEKTRTLTLHAKGQMPPSPAPLKARSAKGIEIDNDLEFRQSRSLFPD